MILEKFGENYRGFKKYENFGKCLMRDREKKHRYYGNNYFDYVENYINENEKKIVDFVNSYNHIKENLQELIYKKFVWEKTNQLITFDIENNFNNNNQQNANKFNIFDIENHGFEQSAFDLRIISGVIAKEDENKFKRLIFRTTRGLIYPNIFDFSYIDSELNYLNTHIIKSEQHVADKKIFVIFIQGQGVLMQKVLKICDLFRASRFGVPTKNNFFAELQILNREIDDKKVLLVETENSIKKFINEKEENVIYNNISYYY